MRPPPIIPCTPAAVLALVVALVVSGCQGSGGAVSVRWRVVDLSTGHEYDPGMQKAVDGSCCVCIGPDGKCETTYVNGQAQCINSWQIESVRIELSDATTGAAIDVPVAPFPCSLREKTTAFVLTPGTFAIGLGALNAVGDGMNVPAPVTVPPPSVRTIVRGDVVNLDVIEIGVDPLPLPP